MTSPFYRPLFELENGSLVAFELDSSRLLENPAENLASLAGALRRDGDLPGADACLCLSLDENALTDPGLPARLGGLIRGAGLAPSNLCLFFSDQTCLRHGFLALHRLVALKTSGYRIGLDIESLDLTPGLFLEMLPADILRLDPLDAMPSSQDGQGLSQLQDFAGFCSNLLMVPAARGVDNAAQAGTLRQAGIRIGQGRYFAGNQNQSEPCGTLSGDACS